MVLGQLLPRKIDLPPNPKTNPNPNPNREAIFLGDNCLDTILISQTKVAFVISHTDLSFVIIEKQVKRV